MVGHEVRASRAIESDPQQLVIRDRSVEGLDILPGQQGAHRLDRAGDGDSNLVHRSLRVRVRFRPVRPCS